MLEKLKYHNVIGKLDRIQGLKQNLDESKEVLLGKLFQKQESSNEYKHLLKRDTTHARQDKTKAPYLDDLKRY